MSRSRVGLISDTHGLLRAEAVDFLRGCDRILHGGDIGDPEVLRQLAALAPLTVVRGNNDTDPWTAELPSSARTQVGSVRLFLWHDRADVDFAPAERGVDVVVSGRSHRPSVERFGRTLWVNPGSAGPRRFRLPVSIAELVIASGAVTARIVELAVAPAQMRES